MELTFHSYILMAHTLRKIAELSGHYSSKESSPLGGSELSKEVFKQRPDETLTDDLEVAFGSKFTLD